MSLVIVLYELSFLPLFRWPGIVEHDPDNKTFFWLEERGKKELVSSDNGQDMFYMISMFYEPLSCGYIGDQYCCQL